MGSRRRVLVVEDEMVVALFVEDLVQECGYEVAMIISRIEDAMDHVNDDNFDMAILDIHVAGHVVFPFADALAERGIPFAFATGYGEGAIPIEHRARPVVQKPLQPESLKRALSRLANDNRARRHK